ncbi:MAG: RNA-binding protein [Rhizobiaceae bacterium]|nr:RNA-binding protein [Rhizobiaceae bacterium]MCV0404779.1 RNA-binding protein [Rhizobiaceae bacterium]
MNDRTCIVTRTAGDPDRLIRFVASPDGTVVADLKRNLPGRGCWVTADRLHVDEAARRGLFARSLKRPVTAPPDLGEKVEALIAKVALGALGLARKGGAVALGAAKVEASVRSGRAILVLHAFEASGDGVRKIAQARRALVHEGGPEIAAYKLFSETELGLALGGAHVIHAAVLAQDAGRAAVKRIEALYRYRGGSPEERSDVAVLPGTGVETGGGMTAAEDTE